MRLGFVVFMLALTGIFFMLGLWQTSRMSEKQALTELIDQRFHDDPVPIPRALDWPNTDPSDWNYMPVTIKGQFRHDQTVLVFTSIDGEGLGPVPGYWVMAPLVLDEAEGGVVLVNRGFVPQQLAKTFADGGPMPPIDAAFTAIARQSEELSAFTPGAEIANRIEYARNIDRLGAMLDPALAPIAPFYVDMADAGDGSLPRGGLTVVSIPNRHLEYALTWFALAILTPIMLVVWWQYRHRA